MPAYTIKVSMTEVQAILHVYIHISIYLVKLFATK